MTVRRRTRPTSGGLPTKTWPGVTVSVLAGMLMLVGACGSSSKSSTATTTASTVSTPASSSTTASTQAPKSATLSVATNAKIGQQILADASGKTVYLYVPDGTSTTSKVSAALKANWPPVTVSGTANAGPGLDATKLMAQAQPDGTQQVAYGGHLLYTFARDLAPGDANGQGIGGIWFAVSPAGTQVG